MVTKVTTHSHDEWLALRKKYIGGSDSAAIVGLNAYASPYSVWAEKTGRTPGFEGNLATEVGTYLEGFVAKKFAAETGKKVRNIQQSFFNDKYPFAIANIDRAIVGEDAGLEIKTTSALNLKKFKNGEYPVNYYVQCMHYMAITEKSKWYLAVLIGNHDFKIFEIERDEEEIEALMEAEAEFYEYLKNDTEPPMDGTKATSEAFTQVHPYSDPEAPELDLTPLRQDLSILTDLGERIKALQDEQDEIKNKVKQYMGDSERASGAGYKVTFKSSERKTLDKKRFMKDYPNIDLEAYNRVSVVRTLIIKEDK